MCLLARCFFRVPARCVPFAASEGIAAQTDGDAEKHHPALRALHHPERVQDARYRPAARREGSPFAGHSTRGTLCERFRSHGTYHSSRRCVRIDFNEFRCRLEILTHSERRSRLHRTNICRRGGFCFVDLQVSQPCVQIDKGYEIRMQNCGAVNGPRSRNFSSHCVHFFVAQEKSTRTWCCTSCSVTACSRASGSAGRDFPIA